MHRVIVECYGVIEFGSSRLTIMNNCINPVLFFQSSEEVNSLKQQVSILHQELEESKRELTNAQEAKEKLTVQLSGDVISLNHQLKEMREENKAVLKAREEEFQLIQERVCVCVCVCVCTCKYSVCVCRRGEWLHRDTASTAISTTRCLLMQTHPEYI